MKVLFIDSVHPILEEQLTAANYHCVDGTSMSREELLKNLSNYEGIVIRSRTKVDREFLDAATALKFIARSGAGLENIDLPYAKGKGIEIFNSPEGNKDAVGEQAIGMLLMLFNHLKRADTEVRQGIWKREENRGLELAGKTVAIIGCGHMGTAFAEKLQGFSCRVIGYDKYKTNYGNGLIEEMTLEEVQREADIVSLHLPLQSDTLFLFNHYYIQAFHKPIYLINTGRGLNVKTDDLVAALKSGKIAGACLDVLEYEKSSFENLNANQLPPAFQYLTQAENVVLSPHVAGWTVESYIKLSTFLAEKIIGKFGEM